METNPYSARAKRTVVASATKTPLTLGNTVKAGRVNPRSGQMVRSSAEPLVGSNGELNASSKRDLMQAIATFQKIMASGEAQAVDSDAKEVKAAREEAFQTALADRSGQGWVALGEVIGDEVWLTLGREGFARSTLLIKPLGKGETGRLRVRQKDVIAFFVTATPNVISSQVRQLYVYPPEFDLIASVSIEVKEIEQASGDLLDDKYQDSLEQILVQEDTTWLNLARTAASTSNDLFFFNTFTPTVFSEMRTQVARWGIPCTSAIVAFDLWNDILSDTEFASWFDPVSKHEIVVEGSLGSIMGVQLRTDAFRYPTLQVLSPGEVFFLGAPQTLGGITQRKELATQAIDKFNQGKGERGWFMQQIEGMAIVNSRALTHGQRV